MFASWPDVAIALTAGPLGLAGAAKSLTPAGRLDWPFRHGVLAAPWAPRLIGAAEVAACAAVVITPGRAAAGVSLACYLMLSAVAYTVRGRNCACFGAARLATVGRGHLVANAVGALAAAAALAAGPGTGHSGLRAGTAALAALATLGAVAVLDRRGADGEGAGTPCGERVDAVRLYTTASCPSCQALRQLVDAMEPARRSAVTTTVLRDGEPLPAHLVGLGVPAAVGVGAAGEPVCAPVSGIGAVKSLIDSVTVRTPDPLTGRGHGR
ncbi:hypothetical protein [Streptomyces griseocarneus]|uniref:hypothetical protein n=1 Tax=Streptomyces griseocarneus TaxID=51201 RepID=UPI00167E829D|nr:hypothetical protein [Streptomyces griseocarneus]MBZ6476397.1 hypothetical protein [Streptomyces griseocarneus]GHG79169.1 hypothetical protein GCM10018779_59830 [Streptomyces griseocarneus]